MEWKICQSSLAGTKKITMKRRAAEWQKSHETNIQPQIICWFYLFTLSCWHGMFSPADCACRIGAGAWQTWRLLSAEQKWSESMCSSLCVTCVYTWDQHNQGKGTPGWSKKKKQNKICVTVDYFSSKFSLEERKAKGEAHAGSCIPVPLKGGQGFPSSMWVVSVWKVIWESRVTLPITS